MTGFENHPEIDSLIQSKCEHDFIKGLRCSGVFKYCWKCGIEKTKTQESNS